MAYNRNQAEQDSLCQSFVYLPHILRLTTATNAMSTALNAGRYRMTSDVDCFVVQGAAGTLAANTVCTPLWGGTYDYFTVQGTADKNVAGITSAGSGYLYMTQQAGER